MNPYLHIRRSLVMAAGMIACLAVGIYVERFGLLYGVNADSYQFFDTVVDVRSQILHNYVEPVDDKKLMQGAIDGMMAQLDPYSTYFSKDELEQFDKQVQGRFSGIGAEMAFDQATGQFIVVSPIEDSPALKAGMLAGDRILKVNGEPLDGMSLKDLVARVSGAAGSEVKMTVLHEGEQTPTELTIKRAVIQVHSVKGYKLINGDGKWDYLIDPDHRIAYVRITNFMESTPEDLDKAMLPLIQSPQGLRGIVLDLRFNPGGLLNAGIAVADRFLESGVIVTTRARDGKTVVEGMAKKEGTYPKIPLVVLINEYSASASEIVAGALKDHRRAVLIGSRSFGKGSVQTLISLDGGNAALKLTTAHYYLPSGQNITRKKDAKTWGVEPDEPFLIPMTDDENRVLLRARQNSEIIRSQRAATLPVAGGSTTASSQPARDESFTADKQLQRAMDVLVGYQALNGEKPFVEVTTTRPTATASLPPETLPATAPATQQEEEK